MREHSRKKKKWVKIDFADGVETREHSENKKKWVKIDFAEGEAERPVCRQLGSIGGVWREEDDMP
ncbi:hypothetical protein SLEP1_g55684 [Rubroshorea leprosula]|uniref:Uncharacterized protein n=1 Tax=Rubroshorea leprosula TaxID=152421 RepID=A0AAV5MKC3_9ROSI|nr:hypothetical protein SLEP1_g55684 [Rubroshorea leprosula]